MKVFIAGPEASVLNKKSLRNNYKFENVLESYYYVKNNIEEKYNDVLEYNEESEKVVNII